jgi:hypothetical protein
MSDAFPVQIGLKQGDAVPQLQHSFALEYAIRRLQENRGIGLELDTSASGLC